MKRPLSLLIATFFPLVACDSKDAAAPRGSEAQTKAEAKVPAEAEKADGKGDEKPDEKPESYGGEFCATIIPCFEKNEFSGNFSADVAIDIRPDGSVEAVSFTGEAPKPVQDCIIETIKGIKLAEYNGKPGHTRCTKSGQLSSGARMVMADMSYAVREEGGGAEAEPGEAEADQADGG